MEEDTKFCSNCKKDISAANFVMHEMHCRRHIVLCEHCDEPIRRTEMEQHFDELHAKIPCEKCQQQVCRPDMAKHLDEECVKKLMKCEYCDLALPKNELESHLNYCGSRTECCPLCQQYIMLKDQLRHENSGCTYPEPKPPPSDPFNMEELRQTINGAALGSLHSAAAAAALGNVRRRNSSNRKSDVNAQRERELLEQAYSGDLAIPPDMDYDTMLALQLAHESWLTSSDEHIDPDENVNLLPGSAALGLSSSLYQQPLVRPFEDDWPSSFVDESHGVNNTAAHDQVQDDEEQYIPCELCDASVPASSYLEHLELCTMPEDAVSGNSPDLNNESLPSTQQSNSRAAIPVINNLGTPTNAQPSSGALLMNNSSIGLDGDFILPCEFCDEMFPSEIIFEHQNVCAANGFATPRAIMPAATHINTESLSPSAPSNPRSFKSPVVKSRPRRQPDPSLLDFVSHDAGDASGLSSRDLINMRVKKQNESVIDKYSPSVNRFDEAVARPPRRPSRQSSQNSDDNEEPSTNNPPWTEHRPNKSAQRARTTLNQLLQEDMVNGASGGRETNNSSSRKSTAPLSGHDLNRVVKTKDVRSRVDSRTVQRQLEQGSHRTSQKSPTKPPASRNQAGQEDNVGQNAPPRQRRRDPMFSPELRLKPDHNPPPKKR